MPNNFKHKNVFSIADRQILHAQYELDFQANNMVLVHDTSFCHEDLLWQVILKSDHAGQSYWPDCSLCALFRRDCDFELKNSDMFLALETSSCHDD